MYTKLEDIKAGQEYILYESGDIIHVRALNNPRNNHPERSCDWLGVELLSIKDNIEFDVGYNTNYPAYAPCFYTQEDFKNPELADVVGAAINGIIF